MKIQPLILIAAATVTALAQSATPAFAVGDRVAHKYNALYRGVITGSEGTGASKCYAVRNDDRSVPDRCLMANELNLEAKPSDAKTPSAKPALASQKPAAEPNENKTLDKLFGTWGTGGFAHTSRDLPNSRTEQQVSVTAAGVVTIRPDGTYSWGSKKGKWERSAAHTEWGPIVLKGAGTLGEDYWVRDDGKTKCDAWQTQCVPNRAKVYLRNAGGSAYTGVRRDP